MEPTWKGKGIILIKWKIPDVPILSDKLSPYLEMLQRFEPDLEREIDISDQSWEKNQHNTFLSNTEVINIIIFFIQSFT